MAAPQLLESDRKRLDDIVGKMVANGESDENIQFVVNDFKQKYAPQSSGKYDAAFFKHLGDQFTSFFGGTRYEQYGPKGGRNIQGTSVPSLHNEGRALDLRGPDLPAYLEWAKKQGAKTIIYNKTIYSRQKDGSYTSKPYNRNPHTDHVHVDWGREGMVRMLGGTHVGSQPIEKPKEKPKATTLKQIAKELPETAAANNRIQGLLGVGELRVRERKPPVNAEIRAATQEELTQNPVQVQGTFEDLQKDSWKDAPNEGIISYLREYMKSGENTADDHLRALGALRQLEERGNVEGISDFELWTMHQAVEGARMLNPEGFAAQPESAWAKIQGNIAALNLARNLVEAATLGTVDIIGDPLVKGMGTALKKLAKAVESGMKVGDEEFAKALEKLDLTPEQKTVFQEEFRARQAALQEATPTQTPKAPQTPATDVVAPKTDVSAPETKPKEKTNASKKPKATGVHADVQPQPLKSEGQVPSEGRGAGVRQEAQGRVQEEVTPPKPPKPPKKAPTKPAPEEPIPARAAANASTTEIRSSARLPGYDSVEPQTFKQWEKEAKPHSTPEAANALAREVHEKDYRLGHSESLGVVNRLNELEPKAIEKGKQIEKLFNAGKDYSALAKEYKAIRDEIDYLTTALNKSGREQARDFVARRGLMNDDSFIGLLAKQRDAADRPLTDIEVDTLRKQVEEFQSVLKQRESRIAELEKGSVERTIASYPRPRTRRAPEIIDSRIADARKRIAEKWKASKPTGARSSLFGAEIPVELAGRVAEIAPDLIELSKLLVEKGILKTEEHLGQIVKMLRKNGINDIGENEVAAAITGRIKGKGVPREATTWEAFKRDLSEEFSNAQKARIERQRFIDKQAEEVKAAYQKAERGKAYAALKAERDALREEERLAREAERAFWKEVRVQQKAYDKKLRDAARLDRQEAVRRWRASIQGKRAGAMNRIDTLQKKLDTLADTGIAMGAKSPLPEAEDAVLQKLRLKEASLRYQWDQAQKKLKQKAEFEKNPKWVQTLMRFNPYRIIREVVASMDDSFPFNQGGMALLSDPKEWGSSFKNSLKAISDSGFEKINAEIRAHPQYDDWKGAGLFEDAADIADIFGASDISVLPVLHQSEQMYAAAGETMRLNLASRWREIAESISGKPSTIADLKRIASEVKTWTGQGEWGKNLKGFSKLAFAARYALTQFEIAVGAPLGRTLKHWIDTGNSAPLRLMVRKYARAYGTAALTVGAINKVAEAYGPKDANGKPLYYIETNPLSGDFGRLVWQGKATIDVLPAPMRLIGLFGRVKEGARVTRSGELQTTEEFKHRGLRYEMVYRFFGNKLHPVPRWFYERSEALMRPDKKYFGKTYDPSDSQAWVDLGLGALPISVQTGKELVESDMTLTEKLIFMALLPFLNENFLDDYGGGKEGKVSVGLSSKPSTSSKQLVGIGK